jgi:hypothetical protein
MSLKVQQSSCDRSSDALRQQLDAEIRESCTSGMDTRSVREAVASWLAVARVAFATTAASTHEKLRPGTCAGRRLPDNARSVENVRFEMTDQGAR